MSALLLTFGASALVALVVLLHTRPWASPTLTVTLTADTTELQEGMRRAAEAIRRYGVSSEEAIERMRLSVVAGLYSSSLRDLIARRLREEQAEWAFIAVVGPRLADELLREVDRRAALIAKRYRESPSPARATPRTLALESVRDDVSAGRLP